MNQKVKATKSERAAVVAEAVLETAHLLGMKDKTLAEVLGLSPGMVSNLRHGKAELEEGKHPFEMAVALIRIYRSLAGIVGLQEKHLRGWFNAHNADLGAVPAELVRKPQGLFTTLTYLDSHRAII
ncbi:transcriptional regulator with XRE-family HTH domain [Litorivivens lipolytica]|uniref:Transcriptional regulator with XRE-family HTH domain n=1 Tax=Litorivivens lipolytica TaxID=1524264 RepID=A0A7W4Z8F3_9GAMM|nr:antitoxin Xre-like helix-turn-helix domain-containing protein [Litorivivens lipolytica]MBB3048901.1 transcriptional regulator with XRE-family HTH domain [Litorivivens lipolytica]